jgi:hypothetical protein
VDTPGREGRHKARLSVTIDHSPGEVFAFQVFGRIAAPLVAVVIRRGFKADLDRLKRILESDGQANG